MFLAQLLLKCRTLKSWCSSLNDCRIFSGPSAGTRFGLGRRFAPILWATVAVLLDGSRQRLIVRSVAPMISAASHHFGLPAIAFGITS
jgi:hypothetical protein